MVGVDKYYHMQHGLWWDLFPVTIPWVLLSFLGRVGCPVLLYTQCNNREHMRINFLNFFF